MHERFRIAILLRSSFFSTTVYYILLWLRKDDERNLLVSFYLYCALFFASHYFDLPVVRFVLFISAPVIALLFIIVHQETLQKNFVRLAKSPLPAQEKNNWVDELIKCCLTALNRHKDIILIIERNDLLKSLIHSPYFIYAELKRDIFDILLDKQTSDNDYMIWINQQGKIVAINSTWRTQLDEAWISKEAQHMHSWKQQAIFITARTDALLFKINPLTRTFDLISQGKVSEGMSAEQAATFMKKNLVPAKSTLKQAQQQVLSEFKMPGQKSFLDQQGPEL